MVKKIMTYLKSGRMAESAQVFLERARIKDVERYQRREAEFLPAALEIVESPPAYASRTVLWTFFTLALTVLLWLVFGSVEEVASAPGKIIPDGYVRVLQAEDKGIIKNIYVAEGQKVKKGDLLLELDETVSAADLMQLKKKVAELRLEAERLHCEKENRPFMPQGADGTDEMYVRTQLSLYNSRRSAQQAKVGEALQGVQQGQAELQRNLAEQEKQRELLQYAQEKTGKLQYLYDQNAISELTVLEQQMKRQELKRSVESQQSAVESQAALLAQKQTTVKRAAAEYATEVDASLAEALAKLNEASEQLKKAEEKHGLCQFIAPDDGYVSNLTVHTIGGIVTPAQVIMEIVPEEANLLAEILVANKDIGFIQTGQRAELKVQTFTFQKYGTVPAVVANISPNAVDDPEQGRAFKVLLQLDKDKMDVNGRMVRLGSGMTVSAEVKTRDKKIYEYFLEPFKKYTSESLRER